MDAVPTRSTDPSATPYPRELEGAVAARDGRTFTVRPIRPSDGPALVHFHQTLSTDSIYRRYFSLHTQLSPDEVIRLTTVDYLDRLALVIMDGDLLVGVGRYDRYPGTAKAEAAFVVLDTYQRQGLGIALLVRLADAAWARGIESFSASTLAINRDMLAVFYDSGFPVEVTRDADEIEVLFRIEPTAEALAHRAELGSRHRPPRNS